MKRERILRKYTREISLKKKTLVFIIVLAYIVLLIKLLVFKSGRDLNQVRSINIVPFYTIKNYSMALYYGNISFKDYLFNIIGNVAVFIPFGLMVPYIMIGMKRFNTFISGVVFVLIIEAYQLEKNIGVFDIDDIMLNIMGVLIGLVAYSIIARIRGLNE